jgi:hypothetical protein
MCIFNYFSKIFVYEERSPDQCTCVFFLQTKFVQTSGEFHSISFYGICAPSKQEESKQEGIFILSISMEGG